MEGVGERAIWKIIRNEVREELEKTIRRVIQIKMNRKIQGD